MTKACETPAPSSTPSADGGYDLNMVQSSSGYSIATYTWTPSCGLSACRGVVFLLHGVHTYTDFVFLSPDGSNRRNQLSGSIVEQLLGLDVMVIAHDHPGHGRSSGVRGYMESFDEMRDITIDIIEHFRCGGGDDGDDDNGEEDEGTSSRTAQMLRGKPCFVLGNSMGGTAAIRVAQARPNLVDGYVLASPAVQPPDDMFGLYGKFLNLVRPALGALAPRLRVIGLPKSEFAELRDAMDNDPLTISDPLRVRMGVEFLRVYEDIFNNAADIKFKQVAVVIGGKDALVSPQGIERFMDRVQCDDKKVFSFEKMGHEVLREPGCEEARDKIVE